MRKRASVPSRVTFEGDVWFERVRPTVNGPKHWFRAGAFHGDDYAEVEGPTREACMRALAPFLAVTSA